jgi:hypothetical protein
MRQSGKTTRLVDTAVQYLFIYGHIRVLTSHEIHNKNFMRCFKPEQIDMFLKFIDEDHRPDNKAQFYFIQTLNKRLANEHHRSVKRISETEFKVI